MFETTLSAEQAAETLRAYRSLHAIEPEYPADTREVNYCRVCGVKVYPVRGGLRHDMSEVAALVNICDPKDLAAMAEEGTAR